MPLGKVVGLGPGHIVWHGDPVGTQLPTAAPPHFRPMPNVAKRSPISATAELLFYVYLNLISFFWDLAVLLHNAFFLDTVYFATLYHENARQLVKLSYTQWTIKSDILFLTITLDNLNRFLQFLYHVNREEILNAIVVKFTTSPQLCAHLTS